MTADAMVNPWNRNFIPRPLLLARGVSGQLKKLTGAGPWDELAKLGIMPLGGAAATSAGDWTNVENLIHVAGLNWRWRATPTSVARSTRNAVLCAQQIRARTLLMPLIGAGTGGLTDAQSESAIHAGLAAFPTRVNAAVHVYIVSLPSA
ncbi:Macro domain-containing protein [Plantibacter flavus]|nr:macro domain-containing protein [Plantibacter flavus]SMG48355.1 Macro domain-containing protein [Plantibacter flavus]